MNPKFVCRSCDRDVQSASADENDKGVIVLTCPLCGAKNQAIKVASAMGHPQSSMLIVTGLVE